MRDALRDLRDIERQVNVTTRDDGHSNLTETEWKRAQNCHTLGIFGVQNRRICVLIGILH